MKMKSTKRALLASALALVLCVSMLIGTTYAWFTDSVASANNIIKSGNLDVELYHSNSYITDEKVGGLTDLFTVEEGKPFLWEPGAVVWENFKVANEGSLALKYQLAMNFTNATATDEGKTLADVLKVAVVSGGFNGTREDAKDLAYNYSLASFALTGSLEADKSDVYGIVIYWEPGANDNDYNVVGGLSITLGVNLFATQFTSEIDSFGPNYDVDAWEATAGERIQIDSVAANIKNDGSASMEVNAAPSTITDKTVIDAPAGSFDPTDKVEVEVKTVNNLFDVTAQGGVVAALDITMTVNGAQTSADLADGKYFTVTTYISKGLSNVSVSYTGTDGKDQPRNVTYDAVTGKLTFQTNHFSDYAVTGAALAYDVAKDTALVTIEQVVEATKAENNAVVIPEVNQDKIEEEINKLPEEKQQAAAAAIAAAKIGDKTYATLSEALAALKDGDTLVLLNNAVVNADTTTTITGKVTIDLNGKTMAGVSTKTGANRSLIVVNKGGDLTVKNGTVTMEHRGANMGWNNSTNALEAVSGGKLTLDTVLVKNLGGSDMAYAVNIANNGGATLKTIKSTLESANYVALRIFNNADGDVNVDLTEGSKLTGASSPFFVHFWSAKDLGNKQAARQAYLKVNFNDTEVSRYSGSKSLVRFGFDDAIYYSTTAMTEVVAGNANALLWALENGKDVLLNNDITVTGQLNVLADTVFNGNGKTLTFTGSASRVIDVASASGADLTVKDLTIDINNSYCQRGINYNVPNGNLVLDNVTITGSTKATYAINLPGSSDGVKVEIKNCDIIGNIALNIWGENSVINVTDSKLSNYDPLEEENYVTISLNDDNSGNAAAGTVLTINGGSIIAKDEKGVPCTAISNMTTAIVNVSDSTEVVGKVNDKVVALIRYKDANGAYYNEFYSSVSIQRAVDTASESDNAVIILRQNIAVDELNVPADVTIDLNGYTLTVGTYTGEGTVTQINN